MSRIRARAESYATGVDWEVAKAMAEKRHMTLDQAAEAVAASRDDLQKVGEALARAARRRA